MRRWLGAVLSLLLLASCARGSGERSLDELCSPPEFTRGRVVLSGGDFGGWRLALYDWQDRAYAVAFDMEGASSGCGTVGPDEAPLAHSGGGAEIDGVQVRHAYGVVRDPVATVRVGYEGAGSVELTPVEVEGSPYRFFAHVRAAKGGFDVRAYDAEGNEVKTG